MKILFYCGHPAHFHLIKNTYNHLKEKGIDVRIVIKRKDILEKLLLNSKIKYYSISNHEYNTRLLKGANSILRLIKYIFFVKKNKFDLLVGTSWESSKVSKLLNVESICLNEDDASVVPFFANQAYPAASTILTPSSCDNGVFNQKSIKYSSYHELAYLHPNNFVPIKKIVEKYFSLDKPYFVIRFAKLKAHHDKGIKGININIAKTLINILKPFGKIYITSERGLERELEPYRININPLDMHHILAFADMYIGDSQTMSAEAGVLGTPFIRYNDFVGKIGYLNELENKYRLGFGFKTNQTQEMFIKIKELLNTPNLKQEFQKRRQKMLADKIDVTAFMVWFVENYPKSVQVMKKNPRYQYNFR